jgi:hypothetical protein
MLDEPFFQLGVHERSKKLIPSLAIKPLAASIFILNGYIILLLLKSEGE